MGVYGSLRPDDDSGMPWTKKACETMHGQKAIVKTAKLYHDSYAVAKLEEGDSEEGRVVGWILTHPDPNASKKNLKVMIILKDSMKKNQNKAFIKDVLPMPISK